MDFNVSSERMDSQTERPPIFDAALSRAANAGVSVTPLEMLDEDALEKIDRHLCFVLALWSGPSILSLIHI